MNSSHPDGDSTNNNRQHWNLTPTQPPPPPIHTLKRRQGAPTPTTTTTHPLLQPPTISLDFEIKPLEAISSSSPQEPRGSLLGFLDLPIRCGLESPSSRATTNPPLQAPPPPPLKSNQKQTRLSDPSKAHASITKPRSQQQQRKIMAAPIPVPDPTNPKPPLPKGKFFQNGILIKPPSPRTTLSTQRAPPPPALPPHLFTVGKPLDDAATACLYRGLDLPASSLSARTLPTFVSDFAGAEMADYSLNFLGCSSLSNLPPGHHREHAQHFSMAAASKETTTTTKSETDVNRKRKKFS
ncbi:hypothetical protein BJ741DRAFT_622447 [Chytriomyces cf. hyalinus JEL632]|nr:hypothetical protein BJ741DRAFT_622447 [Chytriomyces cf. hyalinus JEL632]